MKSLFLLACIVSAPLFAYTEPNDPIRAASKHNLHLKQDGDIQGPVELFWRSTYQWTEPLTESSRSTWTRQYIQALVQPKLGSKTSSIYSALAFQLIPFFEFEAGMEQALFVGGWIEPPSLNKSEIADWRETSYEDYLYEDFSIEHYQSLIYKYRLKGDFWNIKTSLTLEHTYIDLSKDTGGRVIIPDYFLPIKDRDELFSIAWWIRLYDGENWRVEYDSKFLTSSPQKHLFSKDTDRDKLSFYYYKSGPTLSYFNECWGISGNLLYRLDGVNEEVYCNNCTELNVKMHFMIDPISRLR